MEDYLSELQPNKNFNYSEVEDTDSTENDKIKQELRKLGYI